jgi:ABC-type uncharacterized transport system substrate-binding protein
MLAERDAPWRQIAPGGLRFAEPWTVKNRSTMIGLRGAARAISSPHFARKRVPRDPREEGKKDKFLGGGQRNWRLAAMGLTLALSMATATPAGAHPHVWITVKSQIAFTPDGKVAAVIHDWVFDEMYSSFATQGLAAPGELVKREQFAPLAKENAGSLAEIGYFTTLKIGGKAVDFGSVTDYWMQERPDHLVEFHVTLPLKTPTPVTKFLTLRVADPEYFIDFEFDDKDPVKLDSAPSGCSASVARPKPLEADDKQKLTESFFTNLSPGTNFGFKMASAAIIACP